MGAPESDPKGDFVGFAAKITDANLISSLQLNAFIRKHEGLVTFLAESYEHLAIRSLLLQPSGGTRPQRHSILEVLRRSESSISVSEGVLGAQGAIRKKARETPRFR
jgi:HEPN domain-containing protein